MFEWQGIFADSYAFIWGVAGVILFFLFIIILKAIIRVTTPDKLLVVTGRKTKKQGRKFGFSVEKGSTTVIPFFQQVGYLDLGVLPINVRVENVNSANGITVGADATACVCIDDDSEAMLYTSVERLMGKSRKEIHEQIKQTLIGNFRGALNKNTPLQAIGMDETPDGVTLEAGQEREGDRAKFRHDLLKDINSDLSSFGMKVVSVSLQKIWDTSNYIGNLAQKTLAKKRQEVEIEEARLRAKAEQAESDSKRRIEVAKARAEERIILTREKLEVYRQESEGMIKKARLEADNEVSAALNKNQQKVQEMTVELNKLKNLSEVVLMADAEEKASEIMAEGKKEAVNIVEQTRNDILKQKVSLITQAGTMGKSILFIQQQLPHLFEAYKEHAKKIGVDTLVVMDDKTGFSGAVNRGPAAFVDFLKHFENGLGVSVREIIGHGMTKEEE